MTVRVKWFDPKKGFGFLEPDAAASVPSDPSVPSRARHDDVFIHYSNILGSGRGRRNLFEGDRVEFNVIPGDRGPSATRLRVIQPATSNQQPETR